VIGMGVADWVES